MPAPELMASAARRTPVVQGQGLPNPLDRSKRIRGVLFDVDGTLYRQAPLRAAMALELLALPTQGPRAAAGRWRALRAYRGAQEALRQGDSKGSITSAQIGAAAAKSGLATDEVERVVNEWMRVRPLKYLRWFRASGLDECLQRLDRADVRIGVLSDYPAQEKLTALGLQDRFWPVLCSTDAEIGALKPNPRGFLRAAHLWRFDPREVLVIGDRADADAAGAAAAGMSCVIIGGRRRDARRLPNVLAVSSFRRLCDVFDGR
jgi:HAD superfamily hydrolase (TIGR01549 family)